MAEPCVYGLTAFPVPTPDGELLTLVQRYAHHLGRAGGEAILWRPIDNPRSTDEVYRQQRTAEMEAADRYAAKRFDDGTAQAGSRQHYISGEYARAIQSLGLQRRKLPLILLIARPPLDMHAILCLDDRLFAQRATSQALANILLRELSERKLMAFSEGGAITARSMRKIQSHLDHVRRLTAKVMKEAESKPAVGQCPSRKRASSRGRPDPAIATVGKMWLLKGGALMLATYTNDEEDGRVQFGFRAGRPTVQRQLILYLSQIESRRVSVREIVSALYSDRMPCGVGRSRHSSPLQLVKTLVSDTRKTLARGGINPAIISGLGAGATYDSVVELRLQHIIQLGDSDPGDPPLLSKRRGGPDESELPTVDREDSI